MDTCGWSILELKINSMKSSKCSFNLKHLTKMWSKEVWLKIVVKCMLENKNLLIFLAFSKLTHYLSEKEIFDTSITYESQFVKIS